MIELETINLQLNTSDDTLKLGEIIGKSINPGSIIALVGDLGAGKTVLVKGLARGLGGLPLHRHRPGHGNRS